MNPYQQHLKYLLFNDAISTHTMGMNHNAMDRHCIAEVFQEDIKHPEFDLRFEKAKSRYLRLRAEFDINPRYISNGISIPEEELEKLSHEDHCLLTQEDGIDYSEQYFQGYWKSLEELDHYVDEYSDAKNLAYLMGEK